MAEVEAAGNTSTTIVLDTPSTTRSASPPAETTTSSAVTTTTAEDAVTTYINAEGKKVRKVIRKKRRPARPQVDPSTFKTEPPPQTGTIFNIVGPREEATSGLPFNTSGSGTTNGLEVIAKTNIFPRRQRPPGAILPRTPDTHVETATPDLLYACSLQEGCVRGVETASTSTDYRARSTSTAETWIALVETR